jgi:hypothetical protein
VLERKDQGDVAKEVRNDKEEREADKEFQKDFKAKREIINRSRGIPIPKIKKAWKHGIYSQSELQQLCPPGSHCWKDNQRGSWQIHLPPHKRCSRMWSVSGEEDAARHILRESWEQWLTSNGYGVDRCPLKGLF